MREVLYREAYRGRAVWNRTKKRDASGEISAHVITRAEDEWVRRDRPELRIVDEALWEAAHARLEERQVIYLRGTRGQSWGRPVNGIEAKYLLTGLAQCGRCGGPLEVRSRAHEKKRAQCYQCSTHRRRGATICRGIAVPLELADDAILSLLESRVLDPEVLRVAAARVLAQLAAWDPAVSAPSS